MQTDHGPGGRKALPCIARKSETGREQQSSTTVGNGGGGERERSSSLPGQGPGASVLQLQAPVGESRASPAPGRCEGQQPKAWITYSHRARARATPPTHPPTLLLLLLKDTHSQQEPPRLDPALGRSKFCSTL